MYLKLAYYSPAKGDDPVMMILMLLLGFHFLITLTIETFLVNMELFSLLLTGLIGYTKIPG